jgi:hypothetical protein
MIRFVVEQCLRSQESPQKLESLCKIVSAYWSLYISGSMFGVWASYDVYDISCGSEFGPSGVDIIRKQSRPSALPWNSYSVPLDS